MTSSWSYSQTTYPRIQIIDGDTVVVISRQQAVKVNLLYSRLDQCSEIQDSLIATLDSCRSVFRLYDAIVQGYDKEIALYHIAIADRDSVIATQKLLIGEQKKDIKKLRTKSSIMGIGAIVLGILAIGALIF